MPGIRNTSQSRRHHTHTHRHTRTLTDDAGNDSFIPSLKVCTKSKNTIVTVFRCCFINSHSEKGQRFQWARSANLLRFTVRHTTHYMLNCCSIVQVAAAAFTHGILDIFSLVLSPSLSRRYSNQNLRSPLGYSVQIERGNFIIIAIIGRNVLLRTQVQHHIGSHTIQCHRSKLRQYEKK